MKLRNTGEPVLNVAPIIFFVFIFEDIVLTTSQSLFQLTASLAITQYICRL